MHSERPGSKYFYGPQQKTFLKIRDFKNPDTIWIRDGQEARKNEIPGSLDFYNEPQQKIFFLWAVYP